MGFSRQEYWSGLPFPPPGDLSDPGIELVSLVSLVFTRCICVLIFLSYKDLSHIVSGPTLMTLILISLPL